MVAAVVLAAQEGSGVVHELPIPPIAFGLIAFGGLVALLVIAHAFRSIGTRH